MIEDKNKDSDLLNELRKKESSSKFQYDPDVANTEIPEWIPQEVKREDKAPSQIHPAPPLPNSPQDLGKINRAPLGMESEWKNLPPETLPSKGFGYPDGFEIAIKAATVSDIRHFSTVDEADRIDLDDKLNTILSKCMKIRWNGGFLDPFDLWYEDRFFVIMSIRDLTFIKGENRILLPVTKNCTGENCNIADQIELKSNLLDSFVIEEDLLKRYDRDTYSFKFVPKDGTPEMNLFIPTVGVMTVCRKILEEKRKRGKKYDQSFANIAGYIVSDWRGLDERAYDQYERSSNEWTPLQFSIADQISSRINFATKSRIYNKCESCGGEVTAEISFPGGYRSFFIISDIFKQLL